MKKYYVFEATKSGLHLNDLENALPVEEDEEIEDLLWEVVRVHLGEPIRYVGWEEGTYEFEYEWDGEERTVFLVAEEVE